MLAQSITSNQCRIHVLGVSRSNVKVNIVEETGLVLLFTHISAPAAGRLDTALPTDMRILKKKIFTRHKW